MPATTQGVQKGQQLLLIITAMIYNKSFYVHILIYFKLVNTFGSLLYKITALFSETQVNPANMNHLSSIVSQKKHNNLPPREGCLEERNVKELENISSTKERQQQAPSWNTCTIQLKYTMSNRAARHYAWLFLFFGFSRQGFSV